MSVIGTLSSPRRGAQYKRGRRAGGAALLLSVLTALAWGPCPVNADTCYVSTRTGDDANSGVDRGNAWATLSHATVHAGDGDTLHVGGGIYRLDRTITVEKAVRITGGGDDGEAILDGRGAHTCLQISHPEAVVEGLTIRNGYGNPGGVLLESGTLRKCTVSGNITGSWTDHTFVGGILARGSDSRVENCMISGNRGGRWGVGGAEIAEGALLRNCLVMGNWVLGSNASSPGGISAGSDARIENCTVVGNHSPNKNGIGGIRAGRGTVILRNSIVYFNRGEKADDLAGAGRFTESSHNIVGNLASGLDKKNNSTAAPEFMAGGTGVGGGHQPGDYRLFPGSPAIDGGMNQDWMAHAVGLGGNPRISGNAVDIGAYEYPLGALAVAFRVTPESGFQAETDVTFEAGVAGKNIEGLQYDWDFENDGKIDASGPDKKEVTHGYKQSGLKTVRLAVRNDAGDESEAVVVDVVRIGPREVYLAQAGQVPVFPFDSWETAAASLANAVDAAVSGATIHVGEGVYAPAATVVVDRGIAIVGVEGATKTFLDGRDRVRCLRLRHSEATLEGITIIHDGADNVRDFGAVGDGEANDAPAIQAALEAAMGGTLVFPPGNYRLDSSFGVTVRDNLTLRGTPGETVLIFSRDHGLSFGAPSVGGGGLQADVARGDTVLTLEDVDGIQPGDLVSVADSTVRETGWKRPGRHLSYVLSVDAEQKTIEIAHPLNFDFTREAGARASLHRPHGKLRLEGLDFLVGDPMRTWSSGMLSFGGLKGAECRDLRFLGVREHGHNAMSISGCLDSRFQNIYFDCILYGVTVGNSRNTFFEDIKSYNGRHPVVPASWSDGIYVDGLSGDNNQGIMDAHPAFNIHYNHVIATTDGSSNLRSVGGSVRNSIFISRKEIRYGPYFQSVALVDPEIYRDYTFEMENVHWQASRPIGIGNCGTVILRDVRNVNRRGEEVGINVGPHVGKVVLDNTKPGNIRVANVEMVGENRLNAVHRSLSWTSSDGAEQTLEEGYVLDFENNLLSRDSHQMRAHGRIFAGRPGEPVAIKLRIFDNYTGDAASQRWVYGVLKLKAVVDHANAGGYQILEQHYHFKHKRVSAYGLSFQADPVYVNQPAGQQNATLEMALSNPVFGANEGSGERWFQVDVNLGSGRTNPAYHLFYEIELYGRN
ncbi:MAG: hypothetical protein K9N51_00940 [Candidatus Pacebacteria bacterium]|nr:hypothetical protein [Candidatus Paceibacterota bacterium]